MFALRRAVVELGRRSHSSCAPIAAKFSINGDRLWTDIHDTAKWSAPSPGGVTRLCADENGKIVRDWFKEQVLALGADYKASSKSLGLFRT